MHTATRMMTRRRLTTGIAVTVLVVSSILTMVSLNASAAGTRATFGPGNTNVIVDGHMHEHLGSYITDDVGVGYCIEAGQAYPRAEGNKPAYDLPVIRGVSQQDRWALSYALWKWGDTSSQLEASGMAVLAYALSGDASSTNPANLSVSNPLAKTQAVGMNAESQERAYWLDGPWNFTMNFTQTGTDTWDWVVTVTNRSGVPISGLAINVVPSNVIASENPGVPRLNLTDANGKAYASWTQADLNQPIQISVLANAPAYYSVWQAHSDPTPYQAIVVPGQQTYGGSGSAVPEEDETDGSARVLKTTNNPGYQPATGVIFEVRPAAGGDPVGQLIVDATGNSNVLQLPPGSYVAVEISAPEGVNIDPTPHAFTVGEGQTVTFSVNDTVIQQASLSLLKVDDVTGEPLAGAVLSVTRSSNNNDHYDETVPGSPFTTGTEPTVLDGLKAGRYRIQEIQAPPGYILPDDPVQFVNIAWDETAEVVFRDHATATIDTKAQIVQPAERPYMTDDGFRIISAQANDVAVVGASVQDVMTVNGVAADESATIDLALYGPFRPGEDLTENSCTAENEVWSDTQEVTGSGDFTSGAFTPTVAGLYAYVATLTVPHDDVPVVAGLCGDPDETVTLTPSIETEADAPQVTPGAEVADTATVTGLPNGWGATIDTVLYGPFESESAMQNACQSGDLGEPVGTVVDEVTGTGETISRTSSPIALPTDGYAGVYTFIETLYVPNFPPITHECGTPPETFVVPDAPTIITTAQAPQLTPGAPVTDLVLITGLGDGVQASLETVLYGPFENEEALAMACAAGEMGSPVGSVTDAVVGSTNNQLSVESSPVYLPDADYAGVYTFLETLDVPGYPPITHECGTPSETFVVPDAPTIATQALAFDVTPGGSVSDFITVTGLGHGVNATVDTALYGPFGSLEDLERACDSGVPVPTGDEGDLPQTRSDAGLGAPVDMVTDEIVGTGHTLTQQSGSLTLPTTDYSGYYTFIGTLNVPGYPPITHACGDPAETFFVPVSPMITTEAQADGAQPGDEVTDLATVTGLSDFTSASIETTLYGPFEDEADLARACAADEMGAPVGSVTDAVGVLGDPLVQESSPIRLPDGTTDYAGVYTFIATLRVPGYPDITHDCGDPAETFVLAASTDGGGSTDISGGGDALPETGMSVLPFVAIGVIALTAGGVMLSTSRRRSGVA